MNIIKKKKKNQKIKILQIKIHKEINQKQEQKEENIQEKNNI